jgi:hypothetical protein
MNQTKILTLDEIDTRLTEIATRLKEIATAKQGKTKELGLARVKKLLTNPFHDSIEKLEREQRELDAERETLLQERQNTIETNERQAGETAAAECVALREQLTPKAAEAIKALVRAQTLIVEYERILNQASEKAAIAGKKYVPPMSWAGKIAIPGQAGSIVTEVLQAIKRFNGPDTEKLAGTQIVDIDLERRSTPGLFSSDRLYSAPAKEGAPVTATGDPFHDAAMIGAGLLKK